MNKFLQLCVNGRTLKTGEAEKLMEMMMNGDMSQCEIGGILSILAHRGETAEELAGFVKVMRARAQAADGLEDVVDTCGTGGDGISTFNISTAAAITASAAGAKVAKHGNRSVSSKSGSADVLEKLGFPFKPLRTASNAALKRSKWGFVCAAVSFVNEACRCREKELGFRTVFNLLGPLSNPLQAKRQVIGVYSSEKARLMASALEQFDVRHVMLVSARDGLDELSITAPTDVIELKNGERLEYSVSPEQFGFAEGSLKDIQVSSAEESALLIQNIFANEAPSSALHITALNTGAAIYTAGLAKDLGEGTKQL